MALDDVPLEDAGRDYYAKQFGDRVRNIRKYGAAPPSRNPGGRGSRWGAVGGVVALLFVIRIIVAAVTAVSAPSPSSYNNYNSYQPPTRWNNDVQVEPQPWQRQPADLPDAQPGFGGNAPPGGAGWQHQPADLPDAQADEQKLPPELRALLEREPLPVAPDNDPKRPDKDD
jgi:hypothetical protein